MQTQSMAAQLVFGIQCGCTTQAPASTGIVGSRARTGAVPAVRLARLAAVVLLGMATALPVLAADAPAQAEPLKPDLKAGAETAEDVCGACHGGDGNSLAAANPHLAGQHVEYILKQLRDFKPGEDGKPAIRNNAVMAGFAASLEPQDALNVAAYYAAQTLKPSAARDPALVEQGRSIYRGGIPGKGVPACAACHGPAGDGMPAQYPALQGQFADYTAAQLVAFRDGTRKNNQPMTDISLRMTDQEIKAVSDYIAGLRSERH